MTDSGTSPHGSSTPDSSDSEPADTESATTESTPEPSHPAGGDAEPRPGDPTGTRSSARRLLAGVGALILLIVVAAWSVLSLHAPDPMPADGPSDAFSAERAMTYVDRLAQKPHPTGTEENDAVRAYIVDQLTGMGLKPEINSALGVVVRGPDRVNAAAVDNVVAVIPGTDSTGRVFLAAHYDTAQFSPGAGDDSAGVATMLETARILTSGPRLKNDVVLLFTDGEESGTLGSEAFIDSDPLAQDGGVVLNLEARGSSGPVVMFQTSEGNANLARIYADSAPYPVATSAAVEVYRRLRNDTDFSNFLRAGDFTGLNSAFLDGAAVYHTPQDTPERLSRSSLQAMGANALALTRALGDADLAEYAKPASTDRTYFPFLGAIASYPAWLVWPFVALAVIVTLAVGEFARRRRVATVPRLLGGTAAMLIPLILGPLVTYGLWKLLVAIRPGYGSTLDLWHPAVLRVAVVTLVVTVFLAFLAAARRRLGTVALLFGGLIWLTVFGIAFAALAPAASYLTTLPAIAAGIAGIIALLVRQQWAGAVAHLIASVFAVIVLAPSMSMFFAALGMSMAIGPALFTALLCFAALPTLDLLFLGRTADDAVDGREATDRPSRLLTAAVPLVALATTVALVIAGMVVDRFTVEHPEPAQLMYALDSTTGSAHWLSENAPTEYTKQFLDSEVEVGEYFPFEHADKPVGPLQPADVADYFPYIHQKVEVGPAPKADIPAPTLDVVSDQVADGIRTLSVRVAPNRPVRMITLGVVAESGTIEGLRIGDREVGGDAVGTATSAVTFHGPTAEGVTITYRITGDGPVRLRAVDGSDSLDGLPGFVPPPAGVDIAGTHSSGLLMVSTQHTIDRK